MSKWLKWFIILTFPIWFYWIMGLMLGVPFTSTPNYYLNAIWFSYCGFFMPPLIFFLGIPWVCVIIFFVWKDFRKLGGKN